MKIHFLTSKFNGATGGLIYDEILFNKLKTAFSNQVNLITDENFLLENQEESKITSGLKNLFEPCKRIN